MEGDLARHYGAVELLLLTLTGELPAAGHARAAEIALAFLAPVSVAHASTHGAVLARLCGATTSATVGVSAVGLAEQARFLLDRHEALLTWLAAPEAELPEQYRSESAAETASIAPANSSANWTVSRALKERNDRTAVSNPAWPSAAAAEA